MTNFESQIYTCCGAWIKEQLEAGRTWDEIEKLCVEEADIEDRLEDLCDEEMWPEDMDADIWRAYVAHYRETHVKVEVEYSDKVVAIDNGNFSEEYPIPNEYYSTWRAYKESLVSQMSALSIANIQKSCLWILNHLKKDTRTYGPVKGLVTGSVQSGKTASMAGLVSMAADNDWNFFIILSGSIDNLRKQTRDRFRRDLKDTEGGVLWRVLDFTKEDKKFSAQELRLSGISDQHGAFPNRYLTVCLKNRSRLESLIDWLYKDSNRTRKLRIIVIDDEADQASINTAEITPDEEQDRCAINQLIVNLVNGRKSDGSLPETSFQAMNYISYTATPYANVLNESSEESLYPKDFICTLEEADEYFGAKVIFGNSEEDCPGFGIVRDIPRDDEKYLNKLHKEIVTDLPESMKKSVAWFLCASAVLRKRGHRKSISMLIHTSASTKHHFSVYHAIQSWLSMKEDVLSYCNLVYEEESFAVSKNDLALANPKYTLLDSVIEEMPAFDDVKSEIIELIGTVSNILMDEDKTLDYTTGLHLCVDNCKANKEAEEGTYLRIVYPDDQKLKELSKAPVFIVIGGNTLSRGLTIDGLLCTYFSRTVNQADTLMQMARWFGYRKGYELLQRIWMTGAVQAKYEALAKIDMDMKKEIERFMEQGISPAHFGPRIRNIPEIAKFRITAKKKSQMAEYDDFDFCGDSYETTVFDNDDTLQKNLNHTDNYLKKITAAKAPRRSTAAKAYVWEDIPYTSVRDDFLNDFHISEHSSLYVNLKYFSQWIEKMNLEEGRFCDWNVALVDGDNDQSLWSISSDISVGCIERTRKKGKEYIDIGSLRSGRDAICDVDESGFTKEQAEEFRKTRKNGKDIIAKRTKFNLADSPLLLIYRIKKDGGIPRSNNRVPMNTDTDIIGISIIVSGESIGESHAKSLRIIMTD